MTTTTKKPITPYGPLPKPFEPAPPKPRVGKGLEATLCDAIAPLAPLAKSTHLEIELDRAAPNARVIHLSALRQSVITLGVESLESMAQGGKATLSLQAWKLDHHIVVVVSAVSPRHAVGLDASALAMMRRSDTPAAQTARTLLNEIGAVVTQVSMPTRLRTVITIPLRNLA